MQESRIALTSGMSPNAGATSGGKGWRRIALAALASSALILSACATNAAPDTGASTPGAESEATLRVALAPTGTALPVVVADKQGFFEANDIDVTWEKSNVTISDQLASLGRQFDVAMGTQPSLITAVDQGIELVNVSGLALDTVDNPQTIIVASKSSGIKTFADIAGKKVGSLSLTGNIHYALMYAAHNAGVDLTTIDWVVGTVPELPDQLNAGRVDAIEEIEPFAGIAVAKGGVSLGSPFRSIGDEAYLTILLSQKQWANENEAQLGKFTKALAEAADWIENNEDEARVILGEYTGAKGDILAKTPIADFRFQTTGQELAAEQVPDLEVWIDILQKTNDFKGSLKPVDLLPTWAQ